MSTIGAIKRKKGILEGEQNKDLEALKKIERLKKETEQRVKEREMLLIEIERQSIDVAPDSTTNKQTQERKDEISTLAGESLKNSIFYQKRNETLQKASSKEMTINAPTSAHEYGSGDVSQSALHKSRNSVCSPPFGFSNFGLLDTCQGRDRFVELKADF